MVDLLSDEPIQVDLVPSLMVYYFQDRILVMFVLFRLLILIVR
jgi:hypothetical protein